MHNNDKCTLEFLCFSRVFGAWYMMELHETQCILARDLKGIKGAVLKWKVILWFGIHRVISLLLSSGNKFLSSETIQVSLLTFFRKLFISKFPLSLFDFKVPVLFLKFSSKVNFGLFYTGFCN